MAGEGVYDYTPSPSHTPTTPNDLRSATRCDDAGENARGGFPLAAIGASEEVMSAMGAEHHGSTFGCNPVSCAVALAGIDAMEAEALPAEATSPL